MLNCVLGLFWGRCLFECVNECNCIKGEKKLEFCMSVSGLGGFALNELVCVFVK